MIRPIIPDNTSRRRIKLVHKWLPKATESYQRLVTKVYGHSKRQQTKTAISQNGNTKTATIQNGDRPKEI